jgi:hypothetical protein
MKVRKSWISTLVVLLFIIGLLVAIDWGKILAFPWAWLLGVGAAGYFVYATRPRLREYKVREDAGELWTEAFSDKLEMVDKFRELIDDAFLMPKSALGKVAPNDRIHGLYDLCVGGWCVDNMEIEFLARDIKDDFGIAVEESLDWREKTNREKTFGDLFQHILDKKEDNSAAEQKE